MGRHNIYTSVMIENNVITEVNILDFIKIYFTNTYLFEKMSSSILQAMCHKMIDILAFKEVHNIILCDKMTFFIAAHYKLVSLSVPEWVWLALKLSKRSKGLLDETDTTIIERMCSENDIPVHYLQDEIDYNSASIKRKINKTIKAIKAEKSKPKKYEY